MSIKKYPVVRDRDMKAVAVLNKAHKIGFKEIKNDLWTCSFTLPLGDSKVELVQPKYFIELFDHERRIGLFIVNPKKTVKSVNNNEITFNCEHVMSLLHNDVLFGYHQLTNYTTRQVLEYLISLQETKHFRLGRVDFTRYFHYGWENENSLLNAIASVPRPFSEEFIWTWDDTTYPFTLNLVRPSDEIKGHIVAGKNLAGIEIEEDPTSLVTRIYPLGAGEGINQLNISEVNNGSIYLENEEATNKYGLHKEIWVDLRFEDVESLKASGQAILDKYSKPLKSVKINAIDYALIDKYNLSQYYVSDVIKVYDKDTEVDELIRLESREKSDIYGAPFDLKLELGNLKDNINTTFSELQQKQLVHDTYSQGATNIDSRDFSDNCDPNFPAVIRFPIPNDVVNINEMLLTYELVPYRAYSRAIEGGGARVASTSNGGAVSDTTENAGATYTSTSSGGASSSTSSSGGGTSTTTSSGGGTSTTSGTGGAVSKSTSSGGGSVQSSSAENYRPGAGGHNHGFPDRTVFLDKAGRNQVWNESGQHEHTINIPAHTHNFSLVNHTHSVTISAHNHSVTIPNHSHSFSVPNHTHSVTIPSHSHRFEIPDHSHTITMPNHTHEIEHGIFESPQNASSVEIRVNGVLIPFTETNGSEINLIPFLPKDGGGRIQRGTYAEIEIKPNNLARINATVTSRLFIQSRIGQIM